MVYSCSRSLEGLKALRTSTKASERQLASSTGPGVKYPHASRHSSPSMQSIAGLPRYSFTHVTSHLLIPSTFIPNFAHLGTLPTPCTPHYHPIQDPSPLEGPRHAVQRHGFRCHQR